MANQYNIIAGVGLLLAGTVAAQAQQGFPKPPAVLMKTSAEVREKLVGPAVQWFGNRHGIEYVRLNKNGQGQAWAAGSATRSVKWNVKNGKQMGMGAPEDMFFVCLMLPPNASLPKGGETCAQADLLQVTSNAPAPKN